ncbi:MAG: hypothetical protein Terrestrivirus1_174 [Terrestrivirus sp.]|uniref:RING-type domain-containing protein n=1 Tax=Terrestrivirus sp. TaxID=2487775 RepID=A0A3G4ZKE0_9VIRU|nr:MAG: hypothetical protein Terrestrivirus1_174 [Terrestrivirus sp.]
MNEKTCPICIDEIDEKNVVILCNNKHYVCNKCIKFLIENKITKCHSCRVQIYSSVINLYETKNLNKNTNTNKDKYEKINVFNDVITFGRIATMQVSRYGDLRTPQYLNITLPKLPIKNQ